MEHRKRRLLALFMASAAVVLVLAPFAGPRLLDPVYVFAPGSLDYDIFWKIRLPRAATSFLAGSALALSGMVFQSMFRNPLATPFTLGVSSGAAFGAAVSVKAGVAFTLLGVSGETAAAFAGAMLSIAIVYGLSRLRSGFSTATMLLSGVAVSFFFSSLILFIQYISDFTGSFRIIRWLMGGFEVVGFGALWGMLPFIVAGGALVFYLSRELNLLATGSELAASRGVAVEGVKTGLFFAASLMVGAVVSVCGPIGFVGMMAPHMVRLLGGPDHRYLAPASVFFGGAFLTLCDTASRVVVAPAEVPVGIVTALLGGPFFVWLLLGGFSERSAVE